MNCADITNIMIINHSGVDFAFITHVSATVRYSFLSVVDKVRVIILGIALLLWLNNICHDPCIYTCISNDEEDQDEDDKDDEDKKKKNKKMKKNKNKKKKNNNKKKKK